MIGRHDPFADVSFAERLSPCKGYTFNDSTGCHGQFLQNLVSRPLRSSRCLAAPYPTRTDCHPYRVGAGLAPALHINRTVCPRPSHAYGGFTPRPSPRWAIELESYVRLSMYAINWA